MNLANEKILDQLKDQRTKCLVYTRVMGYHRPIESFNIGKKGEHRQRLHFTVNHVPVIRRNHSEVTSLLQA